MKDLEQLSRIAPNAGAPSERAGKVRNIIEQNISGVMFSSGQPKILVEAIGQLLDAECKAAVASALESLYDQIRHYSGEPMGRIGCIQMLRTFSPSPNYIALREAEARLEVLPKLGLLPEPLASEVAKYQAALTEARDKLVKK